MVNNFTSLSTSCDWNLMSHQLVLLLDSRSSPVTTLPYTGWSSSWREGDWTKSLQAILIPAVNRALELLACQQHEGRLAHFRSSLPSSALTPTSWEVEIKWKLDKQESKQFPATSPAPPGSCVRVSLFVPHHIGSQSRCLPLHLLPKEQTQSTDPFPFFLHVPNNTLWLPVCADEDGWTTR